MGLLKFSPTREAISALCDPQARDVVKEPVAEGTLPGLANLGNTCFANSVLQCLLNTPGWFPEACLAFSQFEESTRSSKAALGRSFQRLALEYGSTANGALQRSNSALKNMKEAIAAIDPKYAGCQQQDAYEFLGCLLEGLEEGFGALFRGVGEDRPSPSADIIRAICGVTMHTRRSCHGCSGCFEVDHVTDTGLRLPLLSPAAQFDPSLREKEEQTPISLQELLEATRQPETIEGYDCDVCRGRCAKDGCDYVRPSITQHAGVISATRDVLVVVLYRFGHALDARGNFRPTKVKRQVSCPTQLATETGQYRLFGVVSHLGPSLSSGHYVAAVRSRRDDIWYECNDDRVTPLNLKALYDGRSVTAVRQDAEPYILFYHRDPATADADNQATPCADLATSHPNDLAAATEAFKTSEVPEAQGEKKSVAAEEEAALGAAPEISEGAGNSADARVAEAGATAADIGTNEAADKVADATSNSEQQEEEVTEKAAGEGADEGSSEDKMVDGVPDADMASSPQPVDDGNDMEVDLDLSDWVVVQTSDKAAVGEQQAGEALTGEPLAADGASPSEVSLAQRSVRRRIEKGSALSDKSSDSKGPQLPSPAGGGSCPLFSMLSQVGRAVDWTTPTASTCTAACTTSAEGMEFCMDQWP